MGRKFKVSVVVTILFQIGILENGETKWIKIARNLCLKPSCSLVQLRSHEEKMHFFWVSMYLARKHQLGTLFTSPTGDGTPFYVVIRATRRSSHLQAKAVLSFLSHSETLSVGPVPRIEPATFRSVVERSTDWANPAAVKAVFKEVFNFFQVEISLVGNLNNTCLAVILQDVTFHPKASLCNVMATNTIAQNSVIHQFANRNTINYINLSA